MKSDPEGGRLTDQAIEAWLRGVFRQNEVSPSDAAEIGWCPHTDDWRRLAVALAIKQGAESRITGLPGLVLQPVTNQDVQDDQAMLVRSIMERKLAGLPMGHGAQTKAAAQTVDQLQKMRKIGKYVGKIPSVATVRTEYSRAVRTSTQKRRTRRDGPEWWRKWNLLAESAERANIIAERMSYREPSDPVDFELSKRLGGIWEHFSVIRHSFNVERDVGIIRMVALVALGAHRDGVPEFLGAEVIEADNADAPLTFLRHLRRRGLVVDRLACSVSATDFEAAQAVFALPDKEAITKGIEENDLTGPIRQWDAKMARFYDLMVTAFTNWADVPADRYLIAAAAIDLLGTV